MNRLLKCASMLLLCCTSVQANSGIYKPLALPKANEIVLFTNGLPPATGTRTFTRKEDVLKFLRRGTNNLKVETWYALEYPAHGDNLSSAECSGVFTDKAGHFYFWFLRTPTVLKLQNPGGETALIELKHP